MTPHGVHHLAIQARDLPRLERFYKEVLGLAEVCRWPALGGEHDRSVWLGLGDGGAFLAIERCTGADRALGRPGGAGASAPATGAPTLESGADFFDQAAGLHLVALVIDVTERAAWEARLAGAGVEVVHRTPYTLYFRDPEGNRVGLSHYPVAAPSDVPDA